MSGWWLVPVAFVSMFCQDILGTVLVQAEADGRAHLAAACDTLQDACGLTSLAVLGGTAIDGGHLVFTATAAAAVAGRLLADYSGTYTGVRVGERIRKAVKR